MSDFRTLLPSREDGQTEGGVQRSKCLQVAGGTREVLLTFPPAEEPLWSLMGILGRGSA